MTPNTGNFHAVHVEPIKTKHLIQTSKKIGCPMTFAVKKVYSFPEHKTLADTKRQRTNAPYKMRRYFIYHTQML